MRTTSAAVAKGTIPETHHLKPREGTHLREVFDLFTSNKGRPVAYKCGKHGSETTYLRDFYGLDIRRLHNGVWVLAGEWFGNTYIDYYDTGPAMRGR